MEQETLFTSSKWDILQSLSVGEKSPLELAQLSKTSVANVSQQLRLLELAGFVKSRRISNREKGKPRILYTLAGNYAFFIVGSPYFVDKKFFTLSERQKTVTRIWFLEEKHLQYLLEKAFWQLEAHLDAIQAVLLDKSDYAHPTLIIVGDAALKKTLTSITITDEQNVQRSIKYVFLQPDELKKKQLYPLYDPQHLYQEIKGGKP